MPDTHLARFEQSSISEDRDALCYSRELRMERAHQRIAAVIEKLTLAAWDDIQDPDKASESEVQQAEERVRHMERNVVLQLGWQAGAR